jgi:hypothetical protein
MIIIETIDTTYSELFNITFAHSAYETPLDKFLSGSLSIMPDNDTLLLFKEYKMDYRFFNNVLVCFIKSSLFAPPATDPKIPTVTIDSSTKIRFLIKNSSDLFDKTFVTAQAKKKVYQFSNKVNNTSGSDTFLSAPVEIYNSANDFSQGTIVSDGTNLYGALKTALAASSIPLTNINFWEKLTPLEQVVNNADLQDAAIVQTDENCLAVIDMYKSVTTQPYSFFDTSDKLFDPAPSFKIKFRSTLKF